MADARQTTSDAGNTVAQAEDDDEQSNLSNAEDAEMTNAAESAPDQPLSELPHSVRRKVALYLDNDSILFSCWEQLARKFKVDEVIITKLGYGWQTAHPTKALFDSLKQRHPDLTIKRVKEVARNIKRNDIILFIEKCQKDSDKEDKERLFQADSIDFLDDLIHHFANCAGEHEFGWIGFAEQMKYTNDDILALKGPSKNARYSPTKHLFEFLMAQRPHITVKDIILHCRSLEREDVVCILNKYLVDRNLESTKSQGNSSSSSS